MRGKRNARKGNAPRGAARIILAAVTASGIFSVGGAKAAPIVATWNVDADGHWSDVNAWTGGVPGTVGDIALFTSSTTAPRTITLDQPFTVSTLGFDSGNGYTVGGTNSLRLQGASNTNSASITVTSSNGASVDVLAIPIDLASRVNVSIATGSNLILTRPIRTFSPFQSSITVSGGGTLTLAPGAAGTHRVAGYNIYASTLDVASDGVLGDSSNGVFVNSGGTVRLAAGLRLTHNLSNNSGSYAYLEIPTGTATLSPTAFIKGSSWKKTGAGTLRVQENQLGSSFTVEAGELLMDAPAGVATGPSSITMNGGAISTTISGISQNLAIGSGAIRIGNSAFPSTFRIPYMQLYNKLPSYEITVPATSGIVVGDVSDFGQKPDLVFKGGGTVTLQSYLSSYGDTRLEDGLLLLNGTHTLPGSLFVGTAGVSSATATARLLGSDQINDVANLSVFSNGTFDLNGHSEVIHSLKNDGQIRLAGSLKINGSSADILQMNGSFSGNGMVSYGTFNSLTLVGSSPAFSGTFSANSGKLFIRSNATLGTANLILGGESTNVFVTADGPPLRWPNPVKVIDATFDGPLPMTFGRLLDGFNIVTNFDTTFAGAATLTGRLIKSGTATLTIGELGSPNSFKGSTMIVIGGTLRLANGGISGSNQSDLMTSNIQLNNAVLDLSAAGTNRIPFGDDLLGKNSTVHGSLDLTGSSISGTNLTITGDIIVRDLVPRGTVTTADISFVSRFNVSREIALDTVLGGPGSASASALVNLTINGRLDKPLSAAGDVRGAGTIGGSLTLYRSDPLVQPRLFPGYFGYRALHTGTLTLTGGSQFRPYIQDIPGYASMDVTGGVNLVDTSLVPDVVIFPKTFPYSATFVIINNDGFDPVVGTFANFPNDKNSHVFTVDPIQYTYTVDYHYDANGNGANNDVALTVSEIYVPEPSGVLLSVGTLASLALWRRRARTCVLK